MEAMGGGLNDDCSDLAAFAAGDADAGRRLYDRHAAVLFALCREETGSRSREDAEDAVQETFLRAFRMRDRLTDPTGFRPWLYAIARLVCRESRAARAKTRRDAGYGLGASRGTSQGVARGGAERMADHTAQEQLSRLGGSAPSAPLERSEALAHLGRAIDTLPEDLRLALHIFYIERDPVSVAKEALGISRAQFYRLVAEARNLIAAQLVRGDFKPRDFQT
jgi:RNA polymerase sigma-70 factor (ECF subfamily)